MIVWIVEIAIALVVVALLIVRVRARRRLRAFVVEDAGYHELSDLDWAPPAGWTGEDRVTLVIGHSYYVWTRDDHYAKFRVTALDLVQGRVVVDWAFQIDPSNPELRQGR